MAFSAVLKRKLYRLSANKWKVIANFLFFAFLGLVAVTGASYLFYKNYYSIQVQRLRQELEQQKQVYQDLLQKPEVKKLVAARFLHWSVLSQPDAYVKLKKLWEIYTQLNKGISSYKIQNFKIDFKGFQIEGIASPKDLYKKDWLLQKLASLDFVQDVMVKKVQLGNGGYQFLIEWTFAQQF